MSRERRFQIKLVKLISENWPEVAYYLILCCLIYSQLTFTWYEIFSKLIKAPERRHWRRSIAFMDNSEHISHLVLVFL